MRVADRGENHHVGTDDALQPRHLPGFRNPRLDQRQLLVALDHQHRQRHAQLRIVALGRTVALHPRGQFLGNPLLDDRLAVRTGDAHHRSPELRPVIGRQTLQGRNGVFNNHVTAFRQGFERPFDHKSPHAARIHLRHERMRIVVRAAHGDEHRSRAKLARQRAAVGHHRLHFAVRSGEPAAHDGGDLRKTIFHKIPNGLSFVLSFPKVRKYLQLFAAFWPSKRLKPRHSRRIFVPFFRKKVPKNSPTDAYTYNGSGIESESLATNGGAGVRRLFYEYLRRTESESQ